MRKRWNKIDIELQFSAVSSDLETKYISWDNYHTQCTFHFVTSRYLNEKPLIINGFSKGFVDGINEL